MKISVSNPFTDLGQVLGLAGSFPAPKDTWRLVKSPYLGGIDGLPSLRGIPVATNGIMVAILNGSNQIRFGHAANFVPDQIQSQARITSKSYATNKPLAVFDSV